MTKYQETANDRMLQGERPIERLVRDRFATNHVHHADFVKTLVLQLIEYMLSRRCE